MAQSPLNPEFLVKLCSDQKNINPSCLRNLLQHGPYCNKLIHVLKGSDRNLAAKLMISHCKTLCDLKPILDLVSEIDVAVSLSENLLV
jgi:hypothetical protein